MSVRFGKNENRDDICNMDSKPFEKPVARLLKHDLGDLVHLLYVTEERDISQIVLGVL